MSEDEGGRRLAPPLSQYREATSAADGARMSSAPSPSAKRVTHCSCSRAASKPEVDEKLFMATEKLVKSFLTNFLRS